ncbi:MAG: protein kinase domain-containing protein [Thermoleophilaceae bacterium]
MLSPGLTLAGRYTVLEPISSGAMGAVYRAHDSEVGKDVALKRLTDTRHAARFDIEARLLSALRHPRVVRVLDHFNEPSGRYIVMELIEGTDLGVLIKKRGEPGLPLVEALDYARDACEALQYVHEQQIVHRDVKPQNLIDSRHGVVLVDFGVARELEEEESGTVGIGTPRFMAPEVFAGGTVSPRSDVFGLAATLWTLLTGKPPVYAEPKKLHEICPDVPPELERTIRAGLEMVPERRVASIGAFAKALGGTLAPTRGRSLALSVDRPDAPRSLMEAVVRTAAGVFEAAASSISLTDATTGELVYQSAWGAGAREIVGVRLPPGTGISGAVVGSSQGQAVRDCRSDPRFAAQIAAGTGYVPYTMLVVPLLRGGQAIGALSLLDRRDGGFYGSDDMERAQMFAELAVTALDVQPDFFTSLGDAEPMEWRARR